MPTIQLDDDLELFYFEYRTTTKRPPLLLIHGAGGQHAHWPPQVRRLRNTRTIAPDLPGHGKSGGGAHHTISAYARDMLRLMDALGEERFIPVGHSMGGAVAQQLALTAPERVAGLGLIATGAKLRVAPQILDNALDDPDVVIDFVVTYAFGPHASDDLKKIGRRMLADTPPDTLHADYVACDTFDVYADVSQIDTPALIVVGSADKMTPPKFSQYLAEQIGTGDYYLLEEAGHMLPSEFPGELARIMQRWLEQYTLT